MSGQKPNGDVERPGPVEAGAGFLADMAVGGLRYAREKNRTGESGSVPLGNDLLERLEAQRGLGLGLHPKEPAYDADKIDGTPAEPRQGQRLYNAILNDILVTTNDELKKLEGDPAKSEPQQKTIGTKIGDWATTDYRKRILGLILLFAVLVLMWEMTIKAVERDLNCDSLDGSDGLTQCVNARRAVHDTNGAPNCSAYTCAAPWATGPGSIKCQTCNCGTFCDACPECICSRGSHHVCRQYERYPGDWAFVVRWVLIGVLLAIVVCGAIKWAISTFVLVRRQKVQEEERKARFRKEVKQKDLERIRKDVLTARVCGDGWKQEEPHEGFIRRMKVKLGPHDYQRLVAGGKMTAESDAEAGQVHETMVAGAGKMLHKKTEELLHTAAEKTTPDALVRNATGLSKEGVQRRRGSSLARVSVQRHSPVRYRPQRSSMAAADSRDSPTNVNVEWLDTNEAELHEQALAHFSLTEATYNRAPSRRELYVSLAPGMPPATALTGQHIQQLVSIINEHPASDVPLTSAEFAAEWLAVHKQTLLLDLESDDAQSEDGDAGQGGPTQPINALMQVARTLGLDNDNADSDTSESESESDDGNDTAIVGLLKAVPHLLSLVRGTPAPSRSQAAQQRQAILTAVQGLQNLTGGIGGPAAGGGDDDSESDASHHSRGRRPRRSPRRVES